MFYVSDETVTEYNENIWNNGQGIGHRTMFKC